MIELIAAGVLVVTTVAEGVALYRIHKKLEAVTCWAAEASQCINSLAYHQHTHQAVIAGRQAETGKQAEA
jgi:hypothetical protein